MMAADPEDNLCIPIVDFAPLLAGDAGHDRYAEVGAKVYQAFKEVGFAYIENHGIPQEVVDEAFTWVRLPGGRGGGGGIGGRSSVGRCSWLTTGEQSRRFFGLPQSEKDKLPHPPEGWYHRGYSGIGREKVSQMVFDADGIARARRVPDVKESFELGNEHERRLQNIWPAESALPGFRAFFTAFFETCYQLELRLLRAMAVGMGLDDAGFFVDYHRGRNNQVRLLHYPPVDEALLDAGEVDCIGAHTDFCTLTMLFQDDVGGLEVFHGGRFYPAPYVPGTIVVNIGDFLMRWSNDELRSTLHHVRTPPSVGGGARAAAARAGAPVMTRERYSIPYFVAADGERTIDCVPGCWGPDRPKKYEPINAGEYMDMRLNATY